MTIARFIWASNVSVIIIIFLSALLNHIQVVAKFKICAAHFAVDEEQIRLTSAAGSNAQLGATVLFALALTN